MLRGRTNPLLKLTKIIKESVSKFPKIDGERLRYDLKLQLYQNTFVRSYILILWQNSESQAKAHPKRITDDVHKGGKPGRDCA